MTKPILINRVIYKIRILKHLNPYISKYNNLLANFEFINEELRKKTNEIIHAIENYTNIIDQYNLYNRYRKDLSFTDNYYDKNDTEFILKDINEIESEVKGTEHFYNFEKFDPVEIKKR